MSFITSSRKRIDKVSSDSQAVAFDLLSNLTYMSVLAVGKLPRDRILEQCSQQPFKTAVFFDYIYRMAKRLGFEYTRAFQIVSDNARPSNVKSLLLRFAASISSGESEEEFIVAETKAEAERYAGDYERSVENLRKWTDAYAAILISVTLIMVVSLVSTMMGSIAQNFVILMAFTLFCITSVGIFIIYKSAPVERVIYDRPNAKGGTRRRARRLLMTLAPIGLISALLLAPQLGLLAGSSIAFLLVGASLLPAGFLAWKDSARITKLDSEFPTFLRTLGTVAGATGFTITQALTKIDTRSMGSLKDHINRLNLRLAAKLLPKQCWDKFREETGSELVNRTTHMLIDGTELGGRPDRVGEICSDYALKVTQLRAKRSLTASSFSYLTLPMHATTTFVLVFILQIITNFNTMLGAASTGLLTQAQGAGPIDVPGSLQGSTAALPDAQELTAGMNVFAAQDMTVVAYTMIMVVLILTISNSLAPKFADGGSNLKIITYLSAMCLISGAVLGLVPFVSSKIFTV